MLGSTRLGYLGYSLILATYIGYVNYQKFLIVKQFIQNSKFYRHEIIMIRPNFDKCWAYNVRDPQVTIYNVKGLSSYHYQYSQSSIAELHSLARFGSSSTTLSLV